MPDSETVRILLASRYRRSVYAWLERLEHEAGAHRAVTSSTVPVLVRFSDAGTPGGRFGPAELQAAAAGLRIKVGRHLGGEEYLVYLADHDDQNRLALRGHLDVTRAGHRMIAI